MTEKAKRFAKIDKTDPKYISRREKNRAAVSKCRLKKALEEKKRQQFCRKLQKRNHYLEGRIHGLRRCKKLFIELLLEQAKVTNRKLSQEQIEFIKAADSTDNSEEEKEEEESSETSSSTSSSDFSSSDDNSQHYNSSVNEPQLLQQYKRITDYR
ncbi:hypothetical protein PVAND_005129 [Polypedilum vanderplanki]|uniref:BZIP domain-containing protein n=1 Tax=Polypedilum vanderplanki TaxID=319348 RepID=A0A9J6C045_POLVA|nr:hypothetical protein PVAND_005129 [Polypedilum vanderplanki]